MTIIKNTPGAKHQRRIGAAERLEKLIAKYYQMLREESGVPAPLTRDEVVKKIGIAERELIVLKERIKTGGRKSTKKVHANTGRR